jgi:hypothetical protein
MNSLAMATCLVGLGLVAAPSDGGEASAAVETIARVAALCEQATQDAIKDIWASCNLQAKRLAAAKRARINVDSTEELHDDGSYTFVSVQRKKEVIESLQNAIRKDKGDVASMSRPDAFVSPFFPPTLSIGDVGRMSGPLTVAKVVDGQNMLVSGTVGATREMWPGVAPQRWCTGNGTVWVTGRDTAGLVDGKELPLSPSEVFEVIGTKQCETAAGGTCTVYLVKPVDQAALRAAVMDLRRHSNRFRLAAFRRS